MKCTAALACVLALAMLLTGCKKPTDTAIATAETAESASTAETAATPSPVDALPASVTVGTVLPKSEDAGRGYIDDTLFIGDSNTARYLMYADETGQAFTTLANNIGVVSMGAGAITSLKCEQFSGSSTMYTVPDAVAMLKPQRIVICYGTNNLGGSSTDATSFISTYLQGLKAIETAWPYCDIIVSAIPPLDKQRENTNLTMTQVDAYNAALVVMCEENGYKFLNSAEVLRDDATGWAKTDYTLSDGVHLSKTAVTEYFNYVRTHAYITDDRRPQPLGSIPTPVGPPVNLITKDPIAVRGAKVPLEFVATNGGKLSGSVSQLVKKGATASAVTAVPDAGFVFAGWTASTGGSYSSATISFTMPSDANAGGVVLTAHFTADAHEHEYVEVEGSKTAPTCLKDGLAKYKCKICGEITEKTLKALGHDWDGGTRSGDVITYTCKRCGEKKAEQVEHVHTFDNGKVKTAATCGANGVLVKTCTSCGFQQEEVIYATGQHVRDEGSVDGNTKYYHCTVCGAEMGSEPISTPSTPTTPPDNTGGSDTNNGGGDNGGNTGGDSGSNGDSGTTGGDTGGSSGSTGDGGGDTGGSSGSGDTGGGDAGNGGSAGDSENPGTEESPAPAAEESTNEE